MEDGKKNLVKQLQLANTMPLSQRRQGSAQQVHTTDAASAAAVSFLIGGSALTEACDILVAQQAALSSASASGPQAESQNQNNEDHCQKLAALYQKGKAAYNVICRADNAPDIMSVMTPGNAAAKALSAAHSSQSSLSTTASNTPLPRSRGSFTTPHGNKSKMAPGLIHRKRSSMEGGGRIISRSLSDTSDVSHNNGAPGGGNNNTNRGVAKTATATTASVSKKQQQQQKPRKADPPPEVMNFLKALNAGGSKAAPASTPPPPSSSTTTVGATNNSNDSNATNSRKRPPASNASKQSNKKRAPPPPPPTRRRQSSRSSTSNDDEHEKPNAETTTATTTITRRTRSKRRGASMNANYTRVFDIGETVFVQVDGKHYNAIVKSVDFKADEDDQDEEGGDDAMKIQRPVYEVEFSDGEVMEDVKGDDVHSADEEGW